MLLAGRTDNYGLDTSVPAPVHKTLSRPGHSKALTSGNSACNRLGNLRLQPPLCVERVYDLSIVSQVLVANCTPTIVSRQLQDALTIVATCQEMSSYTVWVILRFIIGRGSSPRVLALGNYWDVSFPVSATSLSSFHLLRVTSLKAILSLRPRVKGTPRWSFIAE